MTIFQHNSGVVDADLRQVVRPDTEGLTIGHGEGKVVQLLNCRLVRLDVGLGSWVSTTTTLAPRCLSAT